MNRKAVALLEILDDHGIDIFTKDDELISNHPYSALQELIDLKYINIIERGKYCRHNFRDENVIGSFIVKDGGVAYWSAMHIHGLTEQIPNVMNIQTSMLKNNKEIFGVPYNFIKVKPEKLVGFKTMGYGNHLFKVTDIEKTIVDCFDQPQYGGGYFEVIKAFNNAKLSAQKMVKYCKAVDNIAVTKRLGFLSEFLEKPKMEYFIRYAQSVKNKKYDVFESGQEAVGEANGRWYLVMNMDEDEIMEIANS